MLTIILGAVLLVIMVFFSLKCKSEGFILFLLGCVFFLGSMLWGLFVPLQGMSEDVRLISTTELVTLSNSTASEGNGSLFYVTVNAENVYSYRYEVEDKYGKGEKSYKVATISKNVTEIESKDCKVPVLEVYKRKPKRGIGTFAMFADETEYVFVVPEGTISHEINLN